jgi:hypothetical protein
MLDHLADDVVFEVAIPEGTPISGEFRGKQAVTDTSQASRTQSSSGRKGPQSTSPTTTRVLMLGTEPVEIKKTGTTILGSKVRQRRRLSRWVDHPLPGDPGSLRGGRCLSERREGLTITCARSDRKGEDADRVFVANSLPFGGISR